MDSLVHTITTFIMCENVGGGSGSSDSVKMQELHTSWANIDISGDYISIKNQLAGCNSCQLYEIYNVFCIRIIEWAVDSLRFNRLVFKSIAVERAFWLVGMLFNLPVNECKWAEVQQTDMRPDEHPATVIYTPPV
jgi:hypothetical protein